MRAVVPEVAGQASGASAPLEDSESPGLHPVRVAVVYAVLGAMWILFSDRLLDALVPPGPFQEQLQTAKGWLFVLATAGLLHLLVRRVATERRQREEAVRATLDSIAEAVWVVDDRACIVNVNRAAVELLGAASKSELLVPLGVFSERFSLRGADGTPFPPEGYATLRALRGETLRGVEAILRRSDGRDIYASITAAPVRHEPGVPPRLAVAVIRDMSEAKRFEEMREDFLATAAHEFKTPLAVIKAQAQLLQKRAQADSQSLQVINRQVERLSRLTHQLLELSRFRLGGPELRRESYDLAEQVVEVLGRLRLVTSAHSFSMAHREPAPVSADRERIEQVLLNLVDNAVRFSPRGGEVEATVRRRDGEAMVSIRDHGVGIPPEKQGRIFERYYRAHAGTGEDYGGIGVGLEMSREIVGRHGGRMWFESTPGEGSTFSFTLPLDDGTPDGR